MASVSDSESSLQALGGKASSPISVTSTPSATPTPTPVPTDQQLEQRLWAAFPGFTISERKKDTTAWTWEFGYDIQNGDKRKWVCKKCLQRKGPKPVAMNARGTQNHANHLYEDHRISAPLGKTKSLRQLEDEARKSQSRERSKTPTLADYWKLDTNSPREQAIANSMIKSFDKKQFRRLLINWIIAHNHSFNIAEEKELRSIFEYLNPCVANQEAHISHTAAKKLIENTFNDCKHKIIKVLNNSPGRIHIAFDGWRSGNRHSFYGICCFFRDQYNHPLKVTLGLPKITAAHTGPNIAAEVLDVIDTFQIRSKIGYFTLDNAKNNDTAMEVIGAELGFEGASRRGRCLGHTLNLSAKALLFGHDVEAFEASIYGEEALTEAEHELWRKKGPVGKLHNMVVAIHRSDKLTHMLRSIQEDHSFISDNPRIRAKKPLDVKLDNDTRWLSQYYMIHRAQVLRPFLNRLIIQYRHEWEMENTGRRGDIRRGAKRPFVIQQENQLTDHDWHVLDVTAEILRYYEDCIKILEGDGIQRKRKKGWIGSYGNIWDVIPTFEFLLERLEEYKDRESELLDGQYLGVNINLAWKKLDEYYTKVEETPIYVTALALHPAYRWLWFERSWSDHPEWVQRAKQQVSDIWYTDYRNTDVARQSTAGPPPKRTKRFHNTLQQHLELSRYGITPSALDLTDNGAQPLGDSFDEYAVWCEDFEPGDREVQNPLDYWRRKEARYPRLSQMALDFLTIQPMSAECERLFSAAGRMASPLRSRLDAMMIEVCQVLRSWHRAGLLEAFDSIFTSPEEIRHLSELQHMSDEAIQEWATRWLNEVTDEEGWDLEDDEEEAELP
ncbi:hypothetical protein DL762_008141 [Monosporascus cannonballus]|uniref:HAT C-terminal dimerisation domain-containing protein n=1 Tax=Monosporascus cannonballus TaxID=155416 RepID=A0ABY0H1A6_9PEZI|nr:hypothetical protein DL762_008141 [Monosporascus cannonballus]